MRHAAAAPAHDGSVFLSSGSVMKYDKPHLTYDRQLARLGDRGLSIADPAAAIADLKRIGYYRLSGYLYPFSPPPHYHRPSMGPSALTNSPAGHRLTTASRFTTSTAGSAMFCLTGCSRSRSVYGSGLATRWGSMGRLPTFPQSTWGTRRSALTQGAGRSPRLFPCRDAGLPPSRGQPVLVLASGVCRHDGYLSGRSYTAWTVAADRDGFP